MTVLILKCKFYFTKMFFCLYHKLDDSHKVTAETISSKINFIISQRNATKDCIFFSPKHLFNNPFDNSLK